MLVKIRQGCGFEPYPSTVSTNKEGRDIAVECRQGLCVEGRAAGGSVSLDVIRFR